MTTKMRVYGEKECGICGKLFTVTNPQQKYCPECRDQSGHKRDHMERIYASNRRKYDRWEREDHPKALDNICENCRKHFVTYRMHETYCSDRCKREFHISHTKCAWCGKPESETDDTRDLFGREWFCCPEHKRLWKIEAARKNGTLKTCPVCGKGFIDNTKEQKRKYCSRSCSSVGRAEEWDKEQEEQKRIRETGVSTCLECGKTYPYDESKFYHFYHYCSVGCLRKHSERTLTGVMKQCSVCGKLFFWSAEEPEPAFGYNACSEECAQVLLKREAEQKRREKERREAEAARIQKEKEERAMEREKRKEERLAAAKEGKKAPRPKRAKRNADDLDQQWVEKNGLCGICRTPYADCTLMQTNFRVKPNGAVYHDSKIIRCPLFG